MIIGLGKTGFSCARYLRAQGESFKVVDSRDHPPYLAALHKHMPDIEVELGEFTEQTFKNASMLIVSPGVSIKTPAIARAIARGIGVSGDVDIFSKSTDVPIIAVTGSNGKSTVATLVARILKNAGLKVGLGGNLDADDAVPALDLLSVSDADFFVLELSSFQLETTECIKAEVSVLLNFSEDHMDRYDDIESYLAAKQRVFCESRKIIVNLDCEFSEPPSTADAEKYFFGVRTQGQKGFGVVREGNEDFISYQGEKIVPTRDLKVVGSHNVSNVLAGMAIATAVGIDMASILEAVKQFAGLENRCQWIAEIEGVDYYNDSKGTNVGATLAAIEGLAQSRGNKIVLIAGGEGKGADFSPLQSVVDKYCRAVVLIGRDAKRIADVIGSVSDCYFASDMRSALQVSHSLALPGDMVLLSPACASFDMYRDYVQRGESFVKSVRSLQ